MKTYINFINESKQDYNELLLNSAKNNDLNGVKKALAKGANINYQNNGGYTALIWASYYGHTDIAKYLIDHNANLDIQDNNGNTALIWASIYRHTDICKLITTKILETEPYRAYELIKYLTPEQKEKYKEFIVGQRDFDLFD